MDEIEQILYKKADRRMCGELYMSMDFPTDKGYPSAICQTHKNYWALAYGTSMIHLIKQAIMERKWTK